MNTFKRKFTTEIKPALSWKSFESRLSKKHVSMGSVKINLTAGHVGYNPYSINKKLSLELS